MMTSMRIDDDLKKDCESVFNDLGLSMTTAVTLFLKQVRKQRAIPFVLSCDRYAPSFYSATRYSVRLRERGRIAERYFNEMREDNEREMTLEEINAEIAAARRERRERAAK